MNRDGLKFLHCNRYKHYFSKCVLLDCLFPSGFIPWLCHSPAVVRASGQLWLCHGVGRVRAFMGCCKTEYKPNTDSVSSLVIYFSRLIFLLHLASPVNLVDIYTIKKTSCTKGTWAIQLVTLSMLSAKQSFSQLYFAPLFLQLPISAAHTTGRSPPSQGAPKLRLSRSLLLPRLQRQKKD